MPRQLPAAPRGFVGRLDQLATLDATDGERAVEMVVISAIGGTGGIGKTWLALIWAHRNLHRFPDGQLAVDLRGFSPGEPRNTADVLGDFLAALGVDHDRQPADLDARAALYRTHTTGKRMLILLDNAAAPDQVVPLLPGGDSCTVLITSRDRLHSLVTRHSARPVRLDVLTDTEADALLTDALDKHPRTTGTERAITDIINLCGGFPLALGLIASRIRTHPDLPADLVAELRDLGVDALDSDDPSASLPTVLSWSLRPLTDEQRTLFGLLGIAPGPDTSLPAVVSLTALPPARARKALSALEEASLVERRAHGRYAMHDLVRAYATTSAHDLPEPKRLLALQRVSDFYLHTAHTAHRLISPHAVVLRPDPPVLGIRPHPLPHEQAAMTWLDTEHLNLLATQHTAAVHHRHCIVWHLAWSLTDFHLRRGQRHEDLSSWMAALDAAVHLPTPVTATRAHRYLGRAHARLGEHKEAIEHLHQALALAQQHDDVVEQAHSQYDLAVAWGRQGDDLKALEHDRQALDLYRTLSNPVWEAMALNAVSWDAAQLSDHDSARRYCQAALILYREHHDPPGEAATLDSLGYIEHQTGRYREAVRHYYQAVGLWRSLGHTYEMAEALDSLGHPYAALGEHQQARMVWREALELYREQGRDDNATRVQQQLDFLDQPPKTPAASDSAAQLTLD